MKVDNTTQVSSPEIPRHNDAQSGAVRENPPAAGFTEPTDKLAISDAHRLTQPNAETQDVRADVVSQTKEAIDDGSFRIDHTKVASRIIYETASLLETLSGVTIPSTQADSDSVSGQQNSQEKFGAGPANERKPGADR